MTLISSQDLIEQLGPLSKVSGGENDTIWPLMRLAKYLHKITFLKDTLENDVNPASFCDITPLNDVNQSVQATRYWAKTIDKNTKKGILLDATSNVTLTLKDDMAGKWSDENIIHVCQINHAHALNECEKDSATGIDIIDTVVLVDKSVNTAGTGEFVKKSRIATFVAYVYDWSELKRWAASGVNQTAKIGLTKSASRVVMDQARRCGYRWPDKQPKPYEDDTLLTLPVNWLDVACSPGAPHARLIETLAQVSITL